MQHTNLGMLVFVQKPSEYLMMEVQAIDHMRACVMVLVQSW